MNTKSKGLFIDRDGVLNIDYGYVWEIEKFRFVDGFLELASDFQEKGYKIFVITNQSGLSRKLFRYCDYYKFTEFYKKLCRDNGIEISDVKCCPHQPSDGCRCRKPRGDMISACCLQYCIDPCESIFFGDKTSDMQAALNAGIKVRVLVSSKIDCDEATITIPGLKHYYKGCRNIFR